ncbi:type II toxin-antitoxin system HipA family toxin [Cellulosimicrobium cellulans]|uniref:type II toxin-antitoxin system HipA family toxin n=1 Tax=Cellulosimicrobium cellulans TaxID=1710 RepID=UPI0018848B88|nr:HipA domain-containing protein [Cellulosimicrobium cellulans]MBE9939600.1 type II toxin-antitoxin system HipA family toxin [Cellulosimicrobium cellulans]
MADLRVELYGRLVGHLVGTSSRTFDFRTDRFVLAHWAPGSTVLSESVPLSLVENRARAARRRNYFAELLPEGRVLSDLAARARLRETDVVGLLARYGRDVAGAVELYDPDAPGEPRTPRATPLTDEQVGALLRDTRGMPLGNSPYSGKSSLAGVQDKIVLALVDDVWHQVHDGYPSTHILKPHSTANSTIIYDEEYATRIAARLGLTHGTPRLHEFDGRTALVIERFDRSPDAPRGRLHQEDMNQALGARGDEKYQEIGGKVSLVRIAQVLRRAAGPTAVDQLLRYVTLAVAMGNLDMHAKNVSMLHLPDGSARVAPMYDVVPLRHQPTDGRLALAVNGVYVHSAVTARDLVTEGEAWGSRAASDVVRSTLDDVASVVASETPDSRAQPGLRDEILGFTRNLLAGRPAG